MKTVTEAEFWQREKKNVKESCEGGDRRKNKRGQRWIMHVWNAYLRVWKKKRLMSESEWEEKTRREETVSAHICHSAQNPVCILSKHGKLTQRSASYSSRTSAMSLRACFTRFKPISKNCTVSRRIIFWVFFFQLREPTFGFLGFCFFWGGDKC